MNLVSDRQTNGLIHMSNGSNMGFAIIFSGFSLILIPFIVSSQQQEEIHFTHQAVYHLRYQPDSSDEKSRAETHMELWVNTEGSLFQSVDKSRRDSTAYVEKNVPMGMIMVRPVNKFNYQILKRNGHIQTFDSAFGINLQGVYQIYYYQEPMDVMAWTIKDDTLTIAGMACQRADIRFGGRDWIAWFAPEIPIPDGPYKFCGLPGLIVSIADSQQHWQFDLTHIRNVEKTVPVNFQSWYEFVPVTKEKLYRKRRAFQNNLVATLETTGIDLRHPTDEAYTHERGKQEINKRMANDNNWIERY